MLVMGLNGARKFEENSWIMTSLPRPTDCITYKPVFSRGKPKYTAAVERTVISLNDVKKLKGNVAWKLLKYHPYFNWISPSRTIETATTMTERNEKVFVRLILRRLLSRCVQATVKYAANRQLKSDSTYSLSHRHKSNFSIPTESAVHTLQEF